jgi:hypothetical protein
MIHRTPNPIRITRRAFGSAAGGAATGRVAARAAGTHSRMLTQSMASRKKISSATMP